MLKILGTSINSIYRHIFAENAKHKIKYYGRFNKKFLPEDVIEVIKSIQNDTSPDCPA